MAVRTSHGIVLFTGDFKFDFTPVDGKLANITRFGELGRRRRPCSAFATLRTWSDRVGGRASGRVSEGLRKVFGEAEGRVLLTTFASNIHRMQQVYEIAAETGRKVAVVGRRMEQNLEICERLGYVTYPEGHAHSSRRDAPVRRQQTRNSHDGQPRRADERPRPDVEGRIWQAPDQERRHPDLFSAGQSPATRRRFGGRSIACLSRVAKSCTKVPRRFTSPVTPIRKS